MSLPNPLEQVAKHPGMYLPRVEFDVAAGLIQGFDLASSGGLLTGFREWLVVRVGYGNNLAWTELALRAIFAKEESPRQILPKNGIQQNAVEGLFKLLGTFWHERNLPQGLCSIYCKYQDWQEEQDWHGNPIKKDTANGRSKIRNTKVMAGK
jgi:hypothetical protein